MTRIAVIVAQQRSGTTVLRKMLNTDPNMREIGEVFSSRHALGAHKVLRQHAMDEGFNFHQAQMAAVFDDLFASLSQRFSEDWLFIDAKYNSFGPFNGYGWRVTEPPQFLSYCMERGVPILHLIRRDVFSVLASERLAVRSKLWHLEQGTARGDTETLQVALRPFKRDYHRLMTEIARFRMMLRGYEACQTVFFEDMLQDNLFQPGAIAQIEGLLGRKLNVQCRAKLAKVSPPPSEFIGNFEELHDYVTRDKALARVYDKLFPVEKAQPERMQKAEVGG